MKDFIIAMDNYFTLPNVISTLRELGIGIVGTARFRRNWPPSKLKEIKQEAVNFNSFHYLWDEFGTLCARWMDNGLVFCVSTVHKVGPMVKRNRKRPRVTVKKQESCEQSMGQRSNKRHLHTFAH